MKKGNLTRFQTLLPYPWGEEGTIQSRKMKYVVLNYLSNWLVSFALHYQDMVLLSSNVVYIIVMVGLPFFVKFGLIFHYLVYLVWPKLWPSKSLFSHNLNAQSCFFAKLVAAEDVNSNCCNEAPLVLCLRC